MKPDATTTIAALSTAPSPAGVAIIRVSGPQSKKALKTLFKSREDPALEANHRKLIFGELVDHKSGDVIDQVLAVFMPGPNSFTGEDIAEIQSHGSPLLIEKILRSLFSFGIRPAVAGEFTQRAFLNGKVDLVQAEAISDLINASSENALRLAAEHLKGRFSSAIDDIGEPLRDLLSEIEAHIDFPEEEINPESTQAMGSKLEVAQAQVKTLLQTYDYGNKVKDGFRVLLCGRPNVGKSSLLNLLLAKQRAIVTSVSGTTRDLLEEEALIAGYSFIFCDSAGITETKDEVERIGIELAKERITWADLVLLVVDASDTEEAYDDLLKELKGKAHKLWMVINKIDLGPESIGKVYCDSNTCAQNFYLSAKTQEGFSSLTEALVEEVKSCLVNNAEANAIVTNERQRNCLSTAAGYLEKALAGLETNQPLEIVSLELRAALGGLEEIVGKTYTEDLLGRIFSKFCIGK